MKFSRNVKVMHGRLDAGPFMGVLFLTALLMIFHSNLVFKPGVSVALGERAEGFQLPVSGRQSGVADPVIAITVNDQETLFFQGKEIPAQQLLLTVEEDEKSRDLAGFVASRIDGIGPTRADWLIESGRVKVNGTRKRPKHRPSAGERVEVRLPASERVRPRMQAELGELDLSSAALLIQADKSVRHETIVQLCTLAADLGFGQALLATRPPDFSGPFAEDGAK